MDINVESFFIGSLLGDACIHNNVFYVKQINQDLIWFKYIFLKTYFPNAKITYRECDAYVDKNNVHHKKYYELSASKIDCLKYFYNLFYKNGIKIYPKDIILRINSLGFAI